MTFCTVPPGRSLIAYHLRAGAAVVNVVPYLDHASGGESICRRGLNALGAPEAAQYLDGGDRWSVHAERAGGDRVGGRRV